MPHDQSARSVRSISHQVNTVESSSKPFVRSLWILNAFRSVSSAFRLIHGYSDISDTIFLILFTWSIAGLCAQLLLFNILVTYFFVSIFFWKYSSWWHSKFDRIILIYVSHFLWQSTTNTLEIVYFCIIMFWTFAAIFGVCEFGERLSATVNGINDVYDQFAWYSFPWDVQQNIRLLS